MTNCLKIFVSFGFGYMFAFLRSCWRVKSAEVVRKLSFCKHKRLPARRVYSMKHTAKCFKARLFRYHLSAWAAGGGKEKQESRIRNSDKLAQSIVYQHRARESPNSEFWKRFCRQVNQIRLSAFGLSFDPSDYQQSAPLRPKAEGRI